MEEINQENKEHKQGTIENEPLKQEQEPFILLSTNDDMDSSPNSQCNSVCSGKSVEYDLSMHSNAYSDELKGKSLGEQVKFLKERGWTFRLISERLNIPMTNCYTAIKKLQLPEEYWDKMKTEVRLKRKAKEAIENHLAAKLFANIPTIPRKRRMQESPQLNDDKNESDSQNLCVPNECTTNSSDRYCTTVEHMSLSGRKHLTLEDGKIVQYWRDKGLTLQKIADKLKMPISSCYRAMKRYQVSQKAVLIIGSENQTYESSSFNASEDSRLCSRSTSELLLGMVDASVHTDAKTKENVNAASASSPEGSSLKDERGLTRECRSLKKRNSRNSFSNCHCASCGVEITPSAVQSIAQHSTTSLNDLNKKENFQSEQIFINTDNQPNSNISRTDNSNHFSVSLDTYYNIATTIKDKLEWASARIAPSTDTEEIVGLMKVVSQGISILKQFDN